MKPTTTEHTNVKLVHDAGDDLPAERITIYPPEIDPEEPTASEHAQPGYETTWIPDVGERAAIANGAPIILRVWGEGHPPVNITAGSPEGQDPEALISRGHADRAAGALMGKIGEQILGGGPTPTPTQALELWTEAVEETRGERPRVDDAALER